MHLTPPKPKVSVLVQQMLNTPMGLSAPQMTRYKTHLGLFCFIRQGERLLLQLKAMYAALSPDALNSLNVLLVVANGASSA